MHVVLGIGNHDEKYAATRHNVGWLLVDALCEKMGSKFRKSGFEFWAAEGRLGRHPTVVIKTWTYVNGTGRVVPELRKRFGEAMMVVCDDVALPLGNIRIRAKGSSGGHNGLKSIIESLGHDSFVRLRFGVGGGRPDVGHVLGRFRKDEESALKETLVEAGEAVRCWMDEGVEKCMSRFNRRSDK